MDRRLLILALGMFAMGTDNFVVAAILPGIAASLGTSVGLAGQMVTVYALSFALLAPVTAAIAGGWSRKALLVSALAIFVVGNVISALASSLDVMLISRALAGLGAALFAPTALGVATSLAEPARRGRALATVTAGLAGATALGSPIGAALGGLGTWRTTLWFVAVLGFFAMIGVWTLLHSLPQPERISLRERIAPVRDPRVALTLLTSMFAFAGFLMVYTYAGLVFDRATGGDERVLASLLLVWGVFATLGNIAVGRLVDRFGSRAIVDGLLLVAIVNFCLLPWSSAHLATAAIALAVWGVCGWGLIVPQQHRLVASAPHLASLLLALNNTATYAGLACSAMLGGLAVQIADHHDLSLFGAACLGLALIFAEGAHALMSKKLEPSRMDEIGDLDAERCAR